MIDPIRLMLVDDHKLTRESWRMLLDNDERFDVIRECDNGTDAIRQAAAMKPDILLVDINMYPLNGFEVAEKILADDPTMKIIGISVNNHPSYANRMIGIGARGYLTKSSSFEEITNAIVEVHQGEKYICSEIKNMQS